VAGTQQALLVAALVMFVSAALTLLFLPDQIKRTPEKDVSIDTRTDVQ
jgi:hypothetical protein